MATDVLRELDSNVTILLVAGAPLAATDPGLASQRAAVKQLAARAPALAKLSEQLDTLASAKGRASATELLHTAARCAQITGAQARPAEAAGEMTALEARAPMSTPLDSVAIARLLRVIAGETDETDDDLRAALDDGSLLDLRLARPAAKLVDDDGSLDDELIIRVVRALGEETLRPIEASFDPKGAYDHALRVAIVAEMRGASALPLVRRAFSEGREEVRSQALRSWGLLDAAEARRECFSLAKSAKQADRALAAEVLETFNGDDEVLELLFSMLRDDPHVWEVSHALHSIKHAGAPARLRELFTNELRDVGEYRAAKPKKGLSPAAKKSADRDEKKRAEAHAKQVKLAAALLGLMGAHRTPALDEVLVDALKNAKNREVRQAARDALVESPREDARELLLAGLGSSEYEERQSAIGALMRMGPAAVERAAPHLDMGKIKDAVARERADEIVQALDNGAWKEFAENPGAPKLDPRWVDLLVPLLALEDAYYSVQSVLAEAAPDRLLDALEKRLGEKSVASVLRSLHGLESVRLPRVSQILVDFMKAPGPWASLKTTREYAYSLAEALRSQDDPSTLEPLRAFVADLKKRLGRGGKNADVFKPLDDTVTALERAR